MNRCTNNNVYQDAGYNSMVNEKKKGKRIKKAEEIVRQYQQLPGFCNYPDNFQILEGGLDFDDYDFV